MRTGFALALVVATAAAAVPETGSPGVGCGAGTYYWGLFSGKHYCVKCPEGYTSVACENCAPDPYHRACSLAVEAVVSVDDKCKPGTFVTKMTKSGCSPCAQGAWSDTYNAAKCQKCPAGHSQPNTGALACYKCANGRFAPKKGAVSCSKCQACPAGSFISTAKVGATAARQCGCSKCAAGKYTANGYTTCFDCAPGRFQPKVAGATCTACAVGRYQGLMGAKTCFGCPAGKTTENIATRALAGCDRALTGKIVCAAGTHIYYDVSSKQVFCRNCAAGRYGAHANDNKYGGMCHACAAGEYQPFEGRTACLKCAAGTVASLTGVRCVRQLTTAAPTKVATKAATKLPKCKTACSATCGAGSAKRSRKVTPTKKGRRCAEPSHERRACNAKNACPGAPVDCKYGKWTKKVRCAKTCDAPVTSTETWTRTGAAPVNGGEPCKALTLIKGCNPFPCPVHCLASKWSKWGACSATCGAGKKTRARTVLRASSNGGTVCPPLEESAPCAAAQKCAIDCVQSDWSSYGECTTACGPGLQYRTRDTEVAAGVGGTACGPTVQARDCTTKPCAADCIMMKWGGWSACSATCNAGFRTRNRNVQRHASGGVACGAQSQTAACFISCPVDCAQTDFTSWSTCSRTCGTGYTRRTRNVITMRAFGGKECGATMEVLTCNTVACPTDCVMEPWGSWGACGKTCGWSHQLRVRSVQRSAEFGGKPCESTTGSKMCKAVECPVACDYSNWSEWSPCSVTCGGGGSQTRLRAILSEAKHGAKACNKASLVDTQKCDSKSPCPVNCKVTQWGAWGACTQSCWSKGLQTKNGPTQQRTRTIANKSANDGTICPSLQETRSCNKGMMCPVDCEVSDFESWTKCSRDCGTGFQSRKRKITLHSNFRGAKCPHLREERKCNTMSCPVNCEMSEWSDFNSCTKTCSTGKQVRRRGINTEGAHGGVSCANKPKTDERLCNEQLCPEDCKLGRWSDFKPCSNQCGGGEQTKYRKILHKAIYGGKQCQPTTFTIACNTHECPIDCKVGVLSAWSTCNKECGGGTQTRSRAITQARKNGGARCLPLSYTQPCNTHYCAVDCAMTAWSAWSTCDAKCNAGKRHSRRTIAVHPAFSGKACPTDMTRTIDCNNGKCAKECTVNSWGSYSICVAPTGKNCGTGTRERTRNIVEQGHESVCPHLKEAEPCLAGGIKCAVDCVRSAWSSWNVCTASCGGGVQDSHRSIMTPARFSGKGCGQLTRRRNCNLSQCPVNEVVGNWGNWDACSFTCGGGHQMRRRTTTVAAEFGGVELKNEDGRLCNSKACAVNCVHGAWGGWTSCTKSCSGGRKKRFRGIERPAQNGGKCNAKEAMESKKCGAKACPTDCKLAAWSELSQCSRSCGVGAQQRQAVVVNKPSNGGRGCGHPLVSIARQVSDKDFSANLSGSSGLTKIVRGTEAQWELKYPQCIAEVLKYCNNKRANCKAESVYTAAQNVIFGESSSVCPRTAAYSFFRFAEDVVLMAVQKYKCDAGPCPVHCTVSQWSSWGDCSVKKCGGGTAVRTRTVTQTDSAGGIQCPNLADVRNCNEQKCPIDCDLAAWGKWSACTDFCGGGRQSRTRMTIALAAFGGEACGSKAEGQDCNTHVCAADCKVSAWGSWFPLEGCTKKCGGGTKWRFKSVISQAAGTGKPCSELEQKQTHPCNQKACDVDCVLTQWSSYSVCSATCGTGGHYRTRRVQVHPRNNGKACGAHVEESACNTHHCPVNCVAQAWHLAAWSSCSATCGWGKRQRSRVPAVQAAFGGRSCEAQGHALTVKQTCHLGECPVHCELAAWGTWSDCSATCNAGFKQRKRAVKTEPMFGGKTCAGHKLGDTTPCNLGICPINCDVGAWGSWGSCTRKCGGGVMKRTRKVVNHGTTLTHGIGRICPFLSETNSCKNNPCPIDCKLGAWGAWDNCNRNCDGGLKKRTRKALQWARHGGNACAALEDSAACNTQVCPVNCEYSNWSKYTACSAQCNGGWSFSRRSVDREAQGSAIQCDKSKLSRQHTCNTHRCHTKEEKCHKLFAQVKDAATAKGAGCFDFLKAKLVAGLTTQGTSSGTCLWTFYTPMDVRHFCPEQKLTSDTVATEYPKCTTLLLATCHTSRFDCHTVGGAELAQGRVWNQFKDTPSHGCPSPSEFKMTVHAAFKNNLAKSVDINVATKSELDSLYGIGAAYATRIIAYRTTFGSFHKVADLEKVAGISAAGVSRMSERAGAKYGKPVVTASQAVGVKHCKFGQTKFVNWFDERKSGSNVDGLAMGRVRLANAKYGELSGIADLGASGPWAVKYTSYSSGSDARSVGDEAVLTVNDVAKSVRNDGIQHDLSQTVLGDKLNYHFGFRSLNDVASRHMAVHNAEVTCVAKPTECIMKAWGAWSDCSRKCNHEIGDGGGLHYRSREVDVPARYGGACSFPRQQRQRCNDHPCPWSRAYEAEDAALKGCAIFDNKLYSKATTPRSSFKGSGYVSMDGDGACRNSASTISWKVEVPKHGRYSLQFRYAVDGMKSHTAKLASITNDQIIVDAQFQQAIEFKPKVGAGFDDWLFTTVDVEFYAGTNTVVVETVPHGADGSKPHLDRLVVTQEKALERCTPGAMVAIDWSALATSSKLVSKTRNGVRMGAAFSGKIAGSIDFGAMGPWSIQMKVDTNPVHDSDSMGVFINKANKANLRGNTGMRTVVVPVSHSTAQFSFHFDALSRDPSSHMDLYNAVAVCQGCSDVTCKRKKLPAFIAGTRDTETKYKIEVSHPHGKTAGNGAAGTGEMHGNHHTCAWSKAWDACQCSCSNLNHQVTRYAMCKASENKYRVTSHYMDATATMKYVERCESCPAGKFAATNNQDKCQWKAVDLYKDSSVQCKRTANSNTPCLDGRYLAGIKSNDQQACCKRLAQDGTPLETARTCYTPNFWAGFISHGKSSVMQAACKTGFHLTGLPKMPQCTTKGKKTQNKGSENVMCCKEDSPNASQKCHWSNTNSCESERTGYVMAGVRYGKGTCRIEAVKCCFALGSANAL